MEYKIKNITQNKIIKDISEKEKERIMCSVSFLNRVIQEIVVYRYFRKNIQNIINASKKEVNTVNDLNDNGEDINCYAWNMINAFYCFIEYNEKQFKEEFCKIKKEIYDEYFEYRLIYFARNYIVHNGIFFIGEQKTLFDNHSVKMEWYINKKVVTEYICKKKAEADEIYSNNNINILNFSEKILEIIDKMQFKIIKELFENIKINFDYLCDNLTGYKNEDIVILFNQSNKMVSVLSGNVVLFIKKFIGLYYNLNFIITNEHKNKLKLFIKSLLKEILQEDEVIDSLLNQIN